MPQAKPAKAPARPLPAVGNSLRPARGQVRARSRVAVLAVLAAGPVVAAPLGTVESLTGDTLTVTAQSGAVTVQLSEQTTIQKRTPGSRETTPGTRADLTAGTRVMVQGPAGEDGTVTAQTIQVLPGRRRGWPARRRPARWWWWRRRRLDYISTQSASDEPAKA